MLSAQSIAFKDLLREQRRTYDNALMTVMNELLVALEESEVSVQFELQLLHKVIQILILRRFHNTLHSLFFLEAISL